MKGAQFYCGAGFTLALSLGLSQAASAQQICDPSFDVEAGVYVKENVPCDLYSSQGLVNGGGLANFAWNTFLALSQPSKPYQDTPTNRGIPDPSITFGSAASLGSNGTYGDTPRTVWDSWREKRELYVLEPNPNFAPPAQPGVGDYPTNSEYVYTQPPAFYSADTPQFDSGHIPLCTGTTLSNAPNVPLQTGKIDNFVDETDEIGLAVLWSNLGAPGPVQVLTDESIVRYQVKFNDVYYETVRNNNWWDPSTINSAVNTGISSGNGIGVSLPEGNNTTSGVGVILTKSAWKKLTPAEVAQNSYYMQTSLYYTTEPTDPEQVCFKEGKFGLIGVHIIRKTKSFPYFFFSTFEYTDNYPNKFTYANTAAFPTANDPDPVQSATLTNAYGVAYADPANPEPIQGMTPQTPGYAATRLVQELGAVSVATEFANQNNDLGIWANYRLVGFQYLPVEGFPSGPGTPYFQNKGPVAPGSSVEGYYPTYYSADGTQAPAKNGEIGPIVEAVQNYYLANPVIETSQRFQFFEGGFGTSGTPNIALLPGATYSDPLNHQGTVSQAAATPKSINMGGCMGCHGNTQATDFSFTLSNPYGIGQSMAKGPSAGQLITEVSAETLRSKCGGDSPELAANFDETTHTCALQ